MVERISGTKLNKSQSRSLTEDGREYYEKGIKEQKPELKRSALVMLTKGLVGQNPDPHAEEKARMRKIEDRLFRERSKMVADMAISERRKQERIARGNKRLPTVRASRLIKRDK